MLRLASVTVNFMENWQNSPCTYLKWKDKKLEKEKSVFMNYLWLEGCFLNRFCIEICYLCAKEVKRLFFFFSLWIVNSLLAKHDFRIWFDEMIGKEFSFGYYFFTFFYKNKIDKFIRVEFYVDFGKKPILPQVLKEIEKVV